MSHLLAARRTSSTRTPIVVDERQRRATGHGRADRDRRRHPPGPAGDGEFDERAVLDSDGILNLEPIPDALVVVGAGVIGIEYASMFAALGTKVTVVEQRSACWSSATAR